MASATTIPVRNLWHLLLYSWDLARLGRPRRVETESAPELLDVVAEVLVDTTADLLRQGLRTDYVERREDLPRIRGRIQALDTARSRLRRRRVAHCVHDDLHIDVLPNQILAGTLELVARRLSARGGAQDLRSEIHVVLSRLHGVSRVSPTPDALSRIQRSRNHSAYDLPLSICRLLAELRLPEEGEGDALVNALLRDETAMERVFERFVRNFLRMRLAGEATVKSEPLDWPLTGERPDVLPQMRTDTTIQWNARRLVIETKYHRSALIEHRGVERLVSTHLYQLYAYLRTQEDRDEAHRLSDGLLLYPTVTRVLDESIAVQGHGIRVATLDLSRPWQEIEGRLLALIGMSDAATVSGRERWSVSPSRSATRGMLRTTTPRTEGEP